MKQQEYMEPQMKIEQYNVNDIIATSGGSNTGNGGGIVLPEDEW